MPRSNRTLGLLAGLALGLGLTACVYNYPQGSQALPGTVLINSQPTGAIVSIPKLGYVDLYTPVELSDDIHPDYTIVIEKEGYRTMRTTLRKLPKQANGSYLAKLRPKSTPESFPSKKALER